MANSNRLAKPYLEELTQEPEVLYKQGFESLLRYLDANAPLADRIGYSVSPKADFARFGQQPFLHFFPAAFADAKFSPDIGEYKLKNSYFGMLGINGALPLHLTEHAIERKRRFKDPTFAEFLDIFNHRFISLFYRAYADAEPAISHDRPENDHFSERLKAIAGTIDNPEPAAKSKNAMHQYLSGLLSHKNRCGKGLVQMLSELLHVKVELQEFVGQWFDIPPTEKIQLGQKNARLGLETVLGDRTYQRSFNFSLKIGPLDHDEYVELLGNKQKFKAVIELTKKYVGNEYSFNIELYLNAQQTRACQLGSARLGHTSWSQGEQGHLKQNNTTLVYTREC